MTLQTQDYILGVQLFQRQSARQVDINVVYHTHLGENPVSHRRMAPSSRGQNIREMLHSKDFPLLSALHLLPTQLNVRISDSTPRSPPILSSIKRVISIKIGRMPRKGHDDIPSSKFRALAFRNPFSSSTRSEKPSSVPTADPRASGSTSPVSMTNATYSGVVSTVPSTIPSTLPSTGTSAATSPESEESPDTAQNDRAAKESSQPLRISIPKSKQDQNDPDGSDALSINSSEISPLGGPRLNKRWSSLEDPGTAVDGGADSLQSNMSVTKSAKMCRYSEFGERARC